MKEDKQAPDIEEQVDKLVEGVHEAFVCSNEFGASMAGANISDAVFYLSEVHHRAFAKCNLAGVTADEVNVVDALMCMADAIRDLAKAVRESRG